MLLSFPPLNIKVSRLHEEYTGCCEVFVTGAVFECPQRFLAVARFVYKCFVPVPVGQ